ncbi:carbon monoxide dehydrogenase subunit G [Gemmatirosa kalamazoonensis]|jgi:carbon monoxide dehydrogenase subunit G|uniref:Carbon monoxide dehydrogenase subunit G n=1 Tax=Gemmatirosa kalamazoonensis TaxID=861299 RepID=W0RF52_9BACT|nr:SRPBCC family protein [Gemmatirosa kalamazoonensis]AHG89699.1 carbon monoxide dehydrogenase subunit G [Gemmatirosa kalamazoonensis]
MKFEETFRVGAPAARVWGHLIDPRQVALCLPGAELTDELGERSYGGRVKVRVGPVTAAYTGKATIVEQDDAARLLRLVAEGRETAGAGSARMTMASRVVALDDGGTEVRVEADVDVVGKLAQFGRGMIDSVGRQLFRQFAECVRARLESEAPEAIPALGPGTAELRVPTAVMEAMAPAPPARILPMLARAVRATLAGVLRRVWRVITFEGRRGRP